MSIKLSTGKISIPVEFDNGDKDFVCFNPNDTNLPVRLLDSHNRIQKRLDEMSFDDFELDNFGEPVSITKPEDIFNLSQEQIDAIVKQTEATAKIIEEAKKIIFEEIDTAFDSDVSRVLFKHCSPLGIVNGEYYVMTVLNALAPVIQKECMKANAQAEKNKEKYLAKYGYGKK